MALLQATAIGLIALIIAPGFFFYFDITPKVALLLAGAAAACCGARLRPGLTRFSVILLAGAASLLLSAAFSSNPALSLYGTNWRRFGAAVQIALLAFAWVVALNTAGRPDRARIILRGVAISSAITALYGIMQYFGWDPILPAAAYHVGQGIWTIVRPPSTLGYVSYFATWLLFAFFLNMALARMETSASWRGLAYGAAAATLIAMLLTGTRAAMLGLGAGGAVLLYRTGFGPARGVLRAGAAAVAMAAVFYFSPAGWQLRNRTRWYTEDRWGGGRPALWRDTLRMAAARLPLGYGPEVFAGAFPPFESKDLAAAYPDFAHESPHNIFLDVLISQGVPGLVLLVAICWMGFRNSAPWLAAALAAGIVDQQFTVFTVPTALIFYVTIGLAIALNSKPAAARYSRGLLFAAAPLAIAFLYLGLRYTMADCALALAQRDIQAGDLASGISHYAEYDRWRLPGTSTDLWFSRALLEAGQKASNPVLRVQALARAGAAALRATGTAEDPFNAWYNLSAFYARGGDAAETERCLRAAIAARPNWYKPHWALAQLLRLTNRGDQAEREAALAAALDGGKHPEVARTLEEIRTARQ